MHAERFTRGYEKPRVELHGYVPLSDIPEVGKPYSFQVQKMVLNLGRGAWLESKIFRDPSDIMRYTGLEIGQNGRCICEFSKVESVKDNSRMIVWGEGIPEVKLQLVRSYWGFNVGLMIPSQERFQPAAVLHLATAQELSVVSRYPNIEVITATDAAKLWKQEDPLEMPSLPYGEASLIIAELENRNTAKLGFDPSWWLVYANGLSLHRQMTRFPQEFYHNGIDRNADWLYDKPLPGYHLIDFRPRFHNSTWGRQERKIQELGRSYYRRAHEAVVSEVILTTHEISGEKLMELGRHWGRSKGVILSSVFSLINLNHTSRWEKDYYLGTCIARKPDIQK